MVANAVGGIRAWDLATGALLNWKIESPRNRAARLLADGTTLVTVKGDYSRAPRRFGEIQTVQRWRWGSNAPSVEVVLADAGSRSSGGYWSLSPDGATCAGWGGATAARSSSGTPTPDGLTTGSTSGS